MAIQTLPQPGHRKMHASYPATVSQTGSKLVSTLQKLRSLGIPTPTVQGAIGITGLRDQLVAGKALNEEQTKYVAQAQQIAMIEATNVLL